MAETADSVASERVEHGRSEGEDNPMGMSISKQRAAEFCRDLIDVCSKHNIRLGVLQPNRIVLSGCANEEKINVDLFALFEIAKDKVHWEVRMADG